MSTHLKNESKLLVAGINKLVIETFLDASMKTCHAIGKKFLARVSIAYIAHCPIQCQTGTSASF